MKHRWVPEGCAIVCGAAWLAALMGGGMLWMGISRLWQLPFLYPGAEYGMEYIADRKFAAAVMILFSAVWLVMALAACWDAASALRKHRNRKS